ncbi:MAG: DUF4296 domain-containing protein [Muribaculaceae bacterium]|nr:DUF4296 domain-containing protein [Muribaculaceae bacterium]
MGDTILHRFLLLVAPLLLAACGNRPSNVLDEDKMVNLMVDMELAEAYNNAQSSYTKNEDMLTLGQRVLAAHGVKPETLDTTLAWYGRNLDEYSALFEKVDKEIMRRRAIYTRVPEEQLETQNNNLWPYSQHLLVNPISGYDGVWFDLESPEINGGDMVRLKFATASPADMNGVIGVEYTDGSGEATNTNLRSNSSFEMHVQSDTGKMVKRIYGRLSFPNEGNYPVFIDSITVTREPFDSVEYRQRKRSQSRFSPMITADTTSSSEGRKSIRRPVF